MQLVTLEQVQQARTTCDSVALRTPLEQSRALSDLAGGDIYLKCENLQRTGAFKIRGAYNRISRLSDDEKARGVVAASAGNHAQGVALAAHLLGVKATVFMPAGAALPKVEATRGYGADARLGGEDYDAAYAAATAFASEQGAVMVHPFDHADIIAGQGTVALEIIEQMPHVETIVVPVGGGGLISGIAAAAKGIKPGIRIVGVEPEGAAGMSASLQAGRVVKLDELVTVADGLATKQSGDLTLAHVRELVDEVVIVTDDEIAEAVLLLAERAKLVVEPSGAVGVAAVMAKRVELTYPAAVVVSGGNVDPALLLRIIRFGLGSAGRYFSFRTRLSDKPGELHRLLGVIAEAGGNVVGVEHHRTGARLRHLGEVEVAVSVETKGAEHVESVSQMVKQAGYAVELD